MKGGLSAVKNYSWNAVDGSDAKLLGKSICLSNDAATYAEGISWLPDF